MGETSRDLGYLLLTVGTALFTFGSVLAALEGSFSIAAANAVVAILLGYLYYRFGRNRRDGPLRNINL